MAAVLEEQSVLDWDEARRILREDGLKALRDNGMLYQCYRDCDRNAAHTADKLGNARTGGFHNAIRAAIAAVEEPPKPIVEFGNTGAEFARFDNEQSDEDLRESYLDITTRTESALDVEVTLAESDYYNCVNASDVHYGPRECAYAKWLKLLEWTLETPDTGMVFNGDLFNAATKSAPGLGPAIDVLEFGGQYRLARADLMPLAKAGKLHAILRGNHDERVMKISGIREDPVERLAHDLSVPYLGYEGFIRWRVCKGAKVQHYTGYHHHGCSAAGTTGGVINVIERLAQRNRADYCAMGHTHRLVSSVVTFREVQANGNVVLRKVPIVNSGSYQQTQAGTYAADKGYSPANVGSASIFLHGDKHSVHSRV